MIRFCRKNFWSIFTVTFITTLVAAMVAAILNGCTPGDRPTSGTAEPSTITLHYQANERVFSPAHWVRYRYLVFANLMRWDENGEMQGWLADRWEHSEDFRTWTYHLRENARWHDGVPITTADIAFTLDLFAQIEAFTLRPDEFELTIVDDHTFTVVAETPGAMGWMQWEIICLPKHLLEDLDPAEYYDWDWWITPVGNGPFRYVTHAPETFTELEANPDYFLDGPGVDRIRIRYGGNGMVELLAGNVDVYSDASLNDARQIAEDSRFVVHAPGSASTYWAIFWNQNRPQFRDANTRKALTLALDRASLFSALDIPEGIPILDGPNPARPGETPPPPLPFDPDSARVLLSDAGWADEDEDGVLERDGVELDFELLAFAGGNDATVLIQNDLAQVGARVSITTLTMDAVRGRMRDGEFDAGIYRNRYDSVMRELLFGSYTNPTALMALEEVDRSFDPDAWRRANQILWTEFQRDVPVTFIHPEVSVRIASRRIRGIDMRRQLLGWSDKLWVEEEGTDATQVSGIPSGDAGGNPDSDAEAAVPDTLPERHVIVSWHEGPENIYVVNPDGSYGERLTDAPEGRGAWVPSFSPDCSEIVFASNMEDGGPADIFIMNADGTEPRRLTRGEAYDYSPGFSPDGSKVFFLRTTEEGWNLWLMNPDGSNQRRLLPDAQETFGHSLSPDRRRFLFLATQPGAPRMGMQPVVKLGGADIYVADVDGSNVRRLTTVRDTTEGNGLGPWSHDGTRIAFGSDRDGNWEVWLMNADGTGQRQLTHTEGETVNTPSAWSPDDRMIAFSSSRDGKGDNPWIFLDVYTVDAASGEVQRRTHLLDEGGFARASGWDDAGIHGTWSPDGSLDSLGSFRLVGEDFVFEETAEPAGHGARCTPPMPEGTR